MITAVTVCMPAFMFLSAISNLFRRGRRKRYFPCAGQAQPGARQAHGGVCAVGLHCGDACCIRWLPI